MPEIAREGPWRVIVWPNDHPPPHVHVKHRQRPGELRIIIADPSGRPGLYSRGEAFGLADVREVLALASSLQEVCWQEWSRANGPA